MPHYTLRHDEAPILTADSVRRDSGSFGDELVLTNLHLIWVKKGTFGRVKNVEYLPLAAIKVIDDRAQAMELKGRLAIFFRDGQTEFGFPGTERESRREVQRWMRAINKAVTGNDLPEEPPTGAAAIAGSIVDAMRNRGGRGGVRRGLLSTVVDSANAARQSAGSSPTARSTAPTGPTGPPPMVSAPCSGCSSSLSGPSGTLVRCRFCESDTVLP